MPLPNRARLEAALNEVLDNFDFQRVERTMRATRWTWWPGHCPDEVRMRASIWESFEYALRCLAENKCPEMRIWVSSGGFVLYIDLEQEWLDLTFQVTHQSASFGEDAA